MKNPKIVLIVGGVGLAFNILGLFVFHQHSHDHGEEHEHTHSRDEINEAEHGHHEHLPDSESSANLQKQSSPAISWQIEDTARRTLNGAVASPQRNSLSSSRSTNHHRSRTRSIVDDVPTHPAEWRKEIMKSARMSGTDADSNTSEEEEAQELENGEPNEETSLLRPHFSRSSRQRKVRSRDNNGALDGSTMDHKNHEHNKPKEISSGGHSHADMNIRGLFLHVLGDALGNIGVMASALIIWLTTSPSRYYADPAISLVITLIILKTAVPMCRDTAKPLLQATPSHISVDDIKKDVEDLPGVKSCHHVHVWALTPSKPIATLDVELEFDFQGENAARYMQLAKEIKSCLHGHGIHSSTVQPEFCFNPAHRDAAALKPDGRGSTSSTSTVQTAIAMGAANSSNGANSEASQEHATCLLDCKDECTTGKQCCGPKQSDSGTSTPKDGQDTDAKSHTHSKPR